MASESLNCSEFSVKSDVWAFGVTLWEIHSLGKCPFSGQQWDPDFNSRVKAGTRLDKPSNCLDDV